TARSRRRRPRDGADRGTSAGGGPRRARAPRPPRDPGRRLVRPDGPRARDHATRRHARRRGRSARRRRRARILTMKAELGEPQPKARRANMAELGEPQPKARRANMAELGEPQPKARRANMTILLLLGLLL